MYNVHHTTYVQVVRVTEVALIPVLESPSRWTVNTPHLTGDQVKLWTCNVSLEESGQSGQSGPLLSPTRQADRVSMSQLDSSEPGPDSVLVPSLRLREIQCQTDSVRHIPHSQARWTITSVIPGLHGNNASASNCSGRSTTWMWWSTENALTQSVSFSLCLPALNCQVNVEQNVERYWLLFLVVFEEEFCDGDQERIKRHMIDYSNKGQNIMEEHFLELQSKGIVVNMWPEGTSHLPPLLCYKDISVRASWVVISTPDSGPPSKSTYWVPEDLMNNHAAFIRSWLRHL